MEEKIVKINVTKNLVYGALMLVIVYGLFLYFKGKSEKLSVEEEIQSDFASMCESGKSAKLSDSSASTIRHNGKLKTEDGYAITINGSSEKFKPSDQFSLSFFSGKEVEVLAEKDSSGEMIIRAIKCTGDEANPKIITDRNSVMKAVAERINGIAPEKPKMSVWSAETFYFVDNDFFYVQYAAEEESDEDYYEEKLLLLRIIRSGDKLDFEKLAYVDMGDDESASRVISGDDIYKDRNDLSLYEFNEDTNSWTLSE